MAKKNKSDHFKFEWKQKWMNFKQQAVYIMMSPVRFFKFLCMVTGFATLSFFLIISLLIFTFFNSLPDIENMKYDDIKKLGIQRVSQRFEDKSKGRYYRWTASHNISRYLIYSIVLSEDGHFFEHEGVDYNAVIRSAIKNYKKGEYASGGSTITQQVVKNIFLDKEKSLFRKLKEYFIAKRLEDKLGKNKILELYLNIAEFGPDMFGVYQASAHYFKKTPSKINAAEGAFMAIMLPTPRRNYLSIYKNKYISKRHKKKLGRILRDMLGMEYISPKQYNRYIRYSYFK